MPVREKQYFTRLLISMFFLFNFYACSSPTTHKNPADNMAMKKEAKPMRLEIKNGWHLEKLTNNKSMLAAVLPNTITTLYFTQDNKLNGKSGCNNYFAGYQLSGNKLSIDKTGSTMMACPEAIMTQEQNYLRQLAQVSTYKFNNEQLHLLDASNNIILVFSASRPVSLTDGTWQLQTYNTGNALLSNLTTKLITAAFSENGKLNGFAGCNRYSALYKTAADKLNITALVTTRKYCHSPDGVMQTENDYIAILAKTDHYRIKHNKLTLYNAANQRIVIFKRTD